MIKETLCEHCVFAHIKDGEQTGCRINRLSVLPNHKQGKYFIVDTYCSACRNVYWRKHENSMDDEIKRVFDEMKMSYDIIIQVNYDADKCCDEDKIVQCLQEVDKLKYKPAVTSILMPYSQVNAMIASKHGLNKNTVFVLTHEDLLPRQIAPVVADSKASYLLFSTEDVKIDEGILDDFNYSLNVLMKPKLLHMDNNFCLCPRFLYKPFMHEENPFQSITDYVTAATTATATDDKCPDSQS